MVEGERGGAAVEDDTTDKRAVLEGGGSAVAVERALGDRVAVFVIRVVVVDGIKFRLRFLSTSTGGRADGGAGTADKGRV